MLAMGNPAAFMQNPAQMNQQPMIPPNMNPNPGMTMLGPGNGVSSLPNSQQQQQQHQRMMMAQAQAHAQAAGGGPVHQLAPGGAPQQQQRLMRSGVPQGIMPPGAAGQVGVGPHQHMSAGGGLNVNPQMGNPFQQGMAQGQMQNPGLRRVPSGAQMGMNSGAATGGMSLMPQQQQQQHQMIPQHMQQMRAMQMQAQNHPNNRPPQHQQSQMGPRPGNNMMQPTMTGVGPSQVNPVMNSLSQPPSMGQQPMQMGMPQGSMQQPFVNGVGIPNSQQQHGLTSSSPRPSVMGMGPGPSQPPGNRASMTPDNTHVMGFVNYGGTQFSPGGQRIPNTPGAFQFGTAPTPPSDMSEPSRNSFPTPAQQLQMSNNANGMSNPNDSFVGGPFASSVPPRPASQNHPHSIRTPQLAQRRTPQPSQHGTPQPGPPTAHHPSPMQTAPSNEHHQSSRPQSRPQSQPQIPYAHAQLSSPRGQTPRSGQVPLPPGATMTQHGHGHGPPGGRLGHQQQQQPNGPPSIIPPPPPPTQGPSRPLSMLQPQHTGGGQPPTPGGSGQDTFNMNPPPNAARAPPPPHPNAGPSNMTAPPQRPPAM